MIPRDRQTAGFASDVTLAIDRSEAARLLRAARDGGARREEAVDWTFASVPDCRHARRLKVETLLVSGDTGGADALIVQGLLMHPTDPALTALRARSLLMQGAPRRAWKEIRLALARRPRHTGTLRLGAEIAVALGDHPQAIDLLRTARRERPQDVEITARLAGTLIEAGCLDAARRTLGTLRRPPALLCARLLRAEERPLEAMDVLVELRTDEPTADRDEIACIRIDLLEELGSSPGLRAFTEEIDQDLPRALLRAGSAWLLLGAFGTAFDRLAPLARVGRYRREALSVRTVAASMLGHDDDAAEALTRLQETDPGADPVLMADLWRRALTARLFRDQHHAIRAGSDRSASLLQPLLRSALEALEPDMQPETESGRDAGVAEIARYRGICLAALGRSRDAAAAFSRSFPAGGAPRAA